MRGRAVRVRSWAFLLSPARLGYDGRHDGGPTNHSRGPAPRGGLPRRWTAPTAAARRPRRPAWPTGSARGASRSSPAATPAARALGDRLRAILLDRDDGRTSALRAEMLLYMASRAQLVEEVIRPALARGRGRRLRPLPAGERRLPGVRRRARRRRGRPGRPGGDGGAPARPDAVLDVPPDVARARVGRARDRIEDRPDDYHARVRDGFLRAAADARAGRARITPRRSSSSTPRPTPTRWPGGSEARWSVPWHSVRGHDRVVDEPAPGPGAGAVPARLPVRRPRGGRQADVRADARPGPALRARRPRRRSTPARPARAASRSRPAPTPTSSRSPGPRTSTSCRSR